MGVEAYDSTANKKTRAKMGPKGSKGMLFRPRMNGRSRQRSPIFVDARHRFPPLFCASCSRT